MKKLLLACLLIVPLAACQDEDRKDCLRGHTETVLIPQTNWVNNVPVTNYIYIEDFVCDEKKPVIR